MENKKLNLNSTAMIFLSFSERLKNATKAMIEFSKEYNSSIVSVRKTPTK